MPVPSRARRFGIAAPLLVCAGHAAPELLGRDGGGSASATMRPRSMTRSVSDSPISSSRSAEISSTASPRARAARELVPDRGLRADVDAAGRVGGDQQHGSPDSSRPMTSFCWLPPDSAAAGTSMPGVRTSNSATIARCRARAAARSIQTTAAAVGALRLVAEHLVLPQRRVEQQAVPVAVLGDVADARLAPRAACPALVMSRAVRGRIVPALARRIPMIVSTSSVWPLPSTPAMPTTSPLWTPKSMSSTGPRHRPPRRRRPSTAQRDASVTVDSRVSGRGQLAAHHHLGQLAARDVPSGRPWRRSAPRRITVIESATASTSSSLWEMKMIVMPSAFSRGRLAKSVVDLLRHQHRGRLVEDEDPRAAVEHLQDLDPLPVADAEALDQLVGVDVQAVRAGELGDAPAGLRDRCRAAALARRG